MALPSTVEEKAQVPMVVGTGAKIQLLIMVMPIQVVAAEP